MLKQLFKKIIKYLYMRDIYAGKNFVWKIDRDDCKKGDPVRCLGVIESESMGTCLELTSGMPVPISQIGAYLQEVNVDAGAPPAGFKRDPSLIDKTEVVRKPVVEELTAQEKILGKRSASLRDEKPEKNEPAVETKKEVKHSDMFNGFKKVKTDFELSVNIELPIKQFIDMMYENSDNKDEFVDKFADYVIENMSKDAIRESIKSMFTNAKETPKSSGVETTIIEK